MRLSFGGRMAAGVEEGWKPVIAHVERYPKLYVHGKPGNELNDLLEQGCLLQINAYSLAREYADDVVYVNAERLLHELTI